MDTCNRKTRVGGLLAIAAAGVVGMMLQSSAQAATIYMTADDAAGKSSLDGTGNLGVLDGNTDYYTSNMAGGTTYYRVRTPGATTGTSTVSFAGQSLHLMGPTGANPTLHYKATVPQDITIANLYVENGATIGDGTTGKNSTLSGALHVVNNGPAATIGAFGSLAAPASFTINSTIDGAGPLGFKGGSNNVLPIVVASTNNSSFSGSVSVFNAAFVQAGDVSLGTGGISVTGGSKLNFTGGTANNYVGNSATLNISATSIVALNFTGTDIVGSVTIETVPLLPVGYQPGDYVTYGAIGSGAKVESARFGSITGGTGGTGFLAIPEPATMGLVSLCGLAMLRRRKA